jgi:hypothetical protein
VQIVNKVRPYIERESTLVHCIQKSPSDEFSRGHNTFCSLRGKGNENGQLGTGFFVCHRIVSTSKTVEHHMKIMLEGEFNAKEGRKNIFKPTIGN